MWFQNRRAKFRRNERSALSSSKSHFTSHTGNGSDLSSPFTSSTTSAKDIEQPISAKSMASPTTTGQSVPSYSSIWRPELPMTSMTSAKYPVISNSATGGYGFSRGDLLNKLLNSEIMRVDVYSLKRCCYTCRKLWNRRPSSI